MSDQFRDYGIEYSWRDGMYSMTVRASSPEDAMERLQAAAARGRCFTPHGIEMIVPAYPGAGLFVRVWTWLRNRALDRLARGRG